MKSAVRNTLVAVLSLSGLNAFAQSTCQTGGGQNAGGTPYVTNGGYPTAGDVQQFLGQVPATVAAPVAPVAAGPQARITVVDPTEANAVSAKTVSATSARITVVSDELSSVATTPAVADSAVSEKLKGLVGNWTAVARYGDNELTTVELQLDDRGWATFTLPGSDGKPKTIKRKVEFENDEIKLQGPEAELVLGKLVSVSSRQMVLEKSGGQVTFVRI